MSQKTTKIEISVSTDDLNKLDEIAKQTGASTADIVRQAISMEVILVSAKAREAKIIIEEKNHNVREIIF